MRMTSGKKSWFLVLLFLMLISSPSHAGFAADFSDVENHWAKPYIDFLAEKKIWTKPKYSFEPNRPITMEEALAWMGDLVTQAYGRISEEKATNKTDFRSPLKKEIDQLAAQINMLMEIDLREPSKVKMGEKMLYLLHLSAIGQPMKQPEIYSDNWWLPAAHLKKSLNREEISMILTHVLIPQINGQFNLSNADIREKYNNLYEWKGQSAYADTYSLYATVIKDFKLMQSDENFQPQKIVTRGEYAVVLKRLYDVWEADKKKLDGNQNEQAKAASFLLAAASLAYKQDDSDEIKRYFSKKATQQLQKIRPMPLHQYDGQLQVMRNESSQTSIHLRGSYQSNQIGLYEVHYVLTKKDDASNPYHWIIDSVELVQR